jgi:hypothetical protein
MTKNPKHPAGNVARKVGSGFLERLLSFLDVASLRVIAGIKHLTGLKRFIAKEDEFDGRMMMRLGAWGVGSIVALVIAIIAVQSPASARRDQASSEVAQQAQQQLQRIAKDSQNQTRQLSAAMDTLNKDRDRLYNRVTVLEQALDAVNGSIAKLSAPPVVAAAVAPASSQPASEQLVAASVAPPPVEVPTASVQLASDTKPSDQKSADTKQRVAEAKKEPHSSAPVASPKIATVATVSPPTPPAKNEQKLEAEAKLDAKSADRPSDQAAAPDQAVAVTGSVASSDLPESDGNTEKPVERTKFGVDLGGANSVEGLRALWRGFRGPHRELFAQMQPLIAVKERSTGHGMQLRLVAGPLTDAAAAAKLCAILTEKSKRACEPSVYDGQRLAMRAYQNRDTAKTNAAAKPEDAETEVANTDAAKPEAVKPEPPKKREASNNRRRVHVRTVAPPPPQPAAPPPPAPPQQRWSLSTIFSGRQQ